ncbi:MAG TPA: TadE family protein [Lacipirellulaceae bacterium]|jgi:Flp pilus assembly protein TadG
MMTTKRKPCASRSGRPARLSRGVAATELAVCLPIIVLLVVATIEACSMVFLKQSLSIAAYEGVRAAVAPAASTAAINQSCSQVLKDRRIAGGTVTINPGNVASLKPGNFVDVTVSAPCTGNTVVPNVFYRGKTITATASMMIEF